MRCCTAKPGLVWLQYDPEIPIWRPANWRRWPQGTVASDMGGDAFGGIYALVYKLLLNLFAFWEFSHDAKDGIYGAYSAMKLIGLQVLFLVVMNLKFGLE